jgi:hypothetical protein
MTGGEGGAPGSEHLLGADEIAFLLCVEANRLEPQARLLCESLRTFAGRYRDAPIYAVSPRPHLAPGPAARRHLDRLGVTQVVAPLNDTGSPYGTINRIVAGAWAEDACPRPYLVLLDTDTFFAAEPQLVRADVGVRPVDVKGSASSGEGDPQDIYWARLCRFAEIALERLPWITTTIDHVRIRASYNGGFAVVRRDLGILRKTQEIFLASLRDDLRPLAGTGLDVLASTGSVGREASEWWGSSQAALSLAIWSTTTDVFTYDARYNIPLHNLVDPGRTWSLPQGAEPLLLHYHYLAEPPYREPFRQVLQRIGCRAEVRAWVEERLSLFEPASPRRFLRWWWRR